MAKLDYATDDGHSTPPYSRLKRAGFALLDRLTGRRWKRSCNVYLARSTDDAIVGTVFNHGGLYAEFEARRVSRDPSALGDAIAAALDGCVFARDFNYWDRKRSDLPVFQVAGSKSIKRFEAEYVAYIVCGTDNTNERSAVGTFEDFQ